MTRFTILTIISIVVFFSACGSHPYHNVRKGETLYSISFQYGHDYRDVAKWNGIRLPYTINPGQRIRLVATTSSFKQKTRTPRPTIESRKNMRVVPSQQKKKSTNTVSLKKITWQWPAQGKAHFIHGSGSSAKKGLNIIAQRGTPVKAASNGHVVYSGNGLARYGNLIIIKHDANYLSAYAHNRKLLVSEGERVTTGQPIAEMGDTGTDKVMLHFEIRRNGKPVDPINYLPKRS